VTDEGRRLALAEHYLDVGRPVEALRVVHELGDAPGERGWLVAAESLRGLGRYQEAAESARRGLEAEPFSVGLLDSLCLSEQELGDFAAAERAVRSALELWPEDPGLLCRYGHLLARAGQLELARRVAADAELQAPDSPEIVTLRMAIAYVAHGRGAAARKGRDLLALEPEDVGAHRSLAVHAAARGDLATATRHMEEVVRVDPADEEAAQVARHFRIESHPLMKPLWPFRRFGPWKFLIAVWVVVGAIAAVAPTVAAAVLLAYVLLAAYSWLVPPIVRASLRRRSR
jgi:Flp pilus assembly protein TadD